MCPGFHPCHLLQYSALCGSTRYTVRMSFSENCVQGWFTQIADKVLSLVNMPRFWDFQDFCHRPCTGELKFLCEAQLKKIHVEKLNSDVCHQKIIPAREQNITLNYNQCVNWAQFESLLWDLFIREDETAQDWRYHYTLWVRGTLRYCSNRTVRHYCCST